MKIKKQLQLLRIEDVTTARQKKNGTVTLKLPIKKYGKFIEVASFKTGYVRNNNCASSNYQLNKQVDGKPEYFKLSNGDYRKYTGKERVLIPNELDRLQYLIDYCLKNYYIKQANMIEDGKFVPKWRYDNLAEAARLDYDCGHYERIRNLEVKLDTIQRISDHG